MAWAFVQDKQADDYNGSTISSLTATFNGGATATAGNLLVATIQYNGQWTGAKSITLPSGWLEALPAAGYGDDTNYSVGYRAFYKLNAAGTETGFTAAFDNPVSEVNLWVGEFSGIATSGALTDSDVVVRAAPGAGTNAIVSDTISVADENSLVIAACHQLNGAGTTTDVAVGTGLTEREKSANALRDYSVIGTKNAAAGSTTATFTSATGGGANSFAVQHLVFKESGAAASVSITGGGELPATYATTALSASPSSFSVATGAATQTLTITDQNGVAVSGATITSTQTGVATVSATTDASGQATVTFVAAGSASLTVAYDDGMSSPTSLLVAVTVTGGLPTAPSGLTATAVGTDSIALAWTDASSNETSFRIERSTDNVTFSEVASASAGVTSALDGGLAPSTTYYYRVRARNAAGNSAYTSTASATTDALPDNAPTAPTALIATASSPTVLMLSWTDNADNEASFEVYEATSEAGPWSLVVTVNPNVTATPLGGRTAGATYYYRVRAYVSSTVFSTYSNVATVTMPAATADPTPDEAGWVRVYRDATTQLWARRPREILTSVSNPAPAPSPSPAPAPAPAPGPAPAPAPAPAPVPATRDERIDYVYAVWEERADEYATAYTANQGSVVYINLTAGVDGSGSFASPRNVVPTFSGGNTYLFREGTSYSGTISWSADNVLVGTYATADGSRVFGRSNYSRLFTINMNGARFAINCSGSSGKVSGVKATQNGTPYASDSTLVFYFSKAGGANDCIIEHCWIDDVTPGTGYQGVSGGIYVRGANATIVGNKITRCELDNIYVGYNGASDGPDGLTCYGNEIHVPDTVSANGPDGLQIASNGTQFGDLEVFDNWIRHDANVKQAIVITGTSAVGDSLLLKQNACIGPDLRETAYDTDPTKSILVDVQNARIEGNYVEAASWGIGVYGAGSTAIGNTVVLDVESDHELGMIAQNSNITIRHNTIVLLSGTCVDGIEQTSGAHSGIVISDNVVQGAFDRGIRRNPSATTEARNIVNGATINYANNGGSAIAAGSGSLTSNPLLDGLSRPQPTSPALSGAGTLSATFVDFWGNSASLTTPFRGAAQEIGS